MNFNYYQNYSIKKLLKHKAKYAVIFLKFHQDPILIRAIHRMCKSACSAVYWDKSSAHQ